MELNVIDTKNSIQVADEVFAQKYNEALIHQVVVAYKAGGRSGSRAQKTRAEVKGSGAKRWKQKGTGRARTSDGKNNIWRAGGVAFAAKPQDHSQKVNKKMFRVALRSILSELVRQEKLMVVDSFKVDEPKTKSLVEKLKQLDVNSVMIVTDALDENLYLSARNLAWVSVRDVHAIDPVSLLRYGQVVVTVSALKQLEERLA